MDFISTENFGSPAEELIWKSLKEAFGNEKGFCWHRHPITSRSGPRLEPDLVILHRELGLNIIEVKGCSIDKIEQIEGHTWYMQDFDPSEIEPYGQAERHMWAVLDRLKLFQNGLLRNQESGNCKIAGRAFVGLPFITEQEWRKRFEDHISAPKWELIFSTDLQPEALLRKFKSAPIKQFSITDEEWEAAVAVVKGAEAMQGKPRRPPKRQDSRAAWLRQVEQQIKTFDLQQHRVAIQIPNGPQRIRGLAGTGKTVVLAQKAAHMHVKYPDWDILFTFNSRALHDQIRRYIIQYVQQFSQGEISDPDWGKIHVWHGWGARAQQGLYRYLCQYLGLDFRNYSDALRFFGTSSGRFAFSKCCEEVLFTSPPELFDSILIDEAQDFAEGYFKGTSNNRFF